ncbi:MAG: hypothetical protein AAF492_20625, partial [Verrucomicrobiota bacterium]
MKQRKMILPMVLLVGFLASTGTAILLSRHQTDLLDQLERSKEANRDLARQIEEKTNALKARKTAPEPQITVVSNDVSAYQHEIDALKEALAEKDRALEALEDAMKTAEAKPPEEKKEVPAWQRFEDRMKKLKEEDPERYKEIQEARNNFKTQLKDNIARKSAFFMNLDTDSMNEEELANHERLIELMEKTWAIQEKF